ncbi:serine hydrolase domain-containing protein, partial [Rubrivirga sp.]|uniref:serine hydrolase domain-containing protein n=1 Tax=Rubrivirga sp. TaxID=1885344 RepID=UPI003C78E4FE
GLGFEPGTRYEYSNSNYVLLAEVVECVTGEPFRSWMQDNVFGPLQMRHTFVGDDHREVIPGRAASYEPAAGGYEEEVLPYSIYGSSGVFSTVGDLARWLSNFGTAEVGGAAVARQMRQRGVLASGDTLGYALGVHVDEHKGLQRIQHSGAIAGYRSFVAYYPEIDAGVVVLGNVSSINPVAAADDVAETFFSDRFETEGNNAVAAGAEPAPDYDPDLFDPATFDAFEGRYEQVGSPGYTLRIARGEDGYVVQLVGQPEWGISPVGPAQFSTRGGLGLTFDVSANGSVDTLSAPRLGADAFFRIPTEPETIVLEDFVGLYHSEELNAVYTLRIDEGELVAVRPRGHEPVPLTHSAGGRFMGDYASPIWGVVFERGPDGTTTGFTVTTIRTQGVRFERVDAGRLPRPDTRATTGPDSSMRRSR